MSRKVFVFICLLLAVFLPAVFAEAQQTKKIYRIGYLSPFDPAFESTRSEAIRLALRELGYIEGQNIAIEYRYTQGKIDRAAELAAELVLVDCNGWLASKVADPLDTVQGERRKEKPFVVGSRTMNGRRH